MMVVVSQRTQSASHKSSRGDLGLLTKRTFPVLKGRDSQIWHHPRAVGDLGKWTALATTKSF